MCSTESTRSLGRHGGLAAVRPTGLGARAAPTAILGPREVLRKLVSSRYCLMTINHAARIGPCGPRPRPRGPAAGGGAPAGGAGAGPRSGWKRYAVWVFGSTAI